MTTFVLIFMIKVGSYAAVTVPDFADRAACEAAAAELRNGLGYTGWNKDTLMTTCIEHKGARATR